MKSYSENKFSQLSLERKVKVMLNVVYRAEESWEQPEKKQELVSQFLQYLKWSNFFEVENSLLKRLASHQFKKGEELSLRELLDFTVPMERYLDSTLKDDKILVREGDRPQATKRSFPVYFVLDHLRSSFNVGSIFRTAECLGVSHIYLVGYTPGPEDRGVQKTAMGTESLVPWSRHHHFSEVAEILKEKSVETVALETLESAEKLQGFVVGESLALVVGNERFGLKKGDLQLVDRCVEIPMMGVKNSLNVANSLSIAAFEMVRQWIR